MSKVNARIALVADGRDRGGFDLSQRDPVWERLRGEAERALKSEPVLASLLYAAILHQPSFEDAVVRRLAKRLSSVSVSGDLLVGAFYEALDADPSIVEAFRADILAVVERDPASGRLLEPFLFFKGFAAIETHRIAHRLWLEGRRDFALYLQSRSSEVFQTDIHPGATFGRGVFIDHATGVVIGETAVIGDDVSILQNVTLGGSGIMSGDRHPKIGNGVMIGAGARVLGPITVGDNARIAAGSVVTHPVPEHSTAVGVPARIVHHSRDEPPAQSMDQMLTDLDYGSFTYVI